MIDVLIVEDSRATREYLEFILKADPDIRRVSVVECGEDALEFLKKNRVGVILMDIHLPGIDGFETTRRIMSSNPVPIVVCTGSVMFNGVNTAMDTLGAGALSLVKKPSGFDDPDAESEAAALVQTIKLMSEITVVRRWDRNKPMAPDAISSVPPTAPFDIVARDIAVVAIGASTGGPPALLSILTGLPADFPTPILVVQHITAGFTSGLVSWLASACGLPVYLAENGVIPLPGHVYVAPDDRHLRIGLHGELRTAQDEPQNNVRPSVGVLFRSVADRFGRRAAGVLLTGMGQDGAQELKSMADQGALTVAQDQASSVVFGMPAQAIKLGGARFVLPPHQIAELLVAAVRSPHESGRP